MMKFKHTTTFNKLILQDVDQNPLLAPNQDAAKIPSKATLNLPATSTATPVTLQTPSKASQLPPVQDKRPVSPTQVSLDAAGTQKLTTPHETLLSVTQNELPSSPKPPKPTKLFFSTEQLAPLPPETAESSSSSRSKQIDKIEVSKPKDEASKPKVEAFKPKVEVSKPKVEASKPHVAPLKEPLDNSAPSIKTPPSSSMSLIQDVEKAKKEINKILKLAPKGKPEFKALLEKLEMLKKHIEMEIEPKVAAVIARSNEGQHEQEQPSSLLEFNAGETLLYGADSLIAAVAEFWKLFDL
jgi:hypothetical protein